MTTDRPRRLAAPTLLFAVTLVLAGCGTGFDAATNQQYQPAVGANQREGDVRLYNVLLVENTDGTFSLSAGVVNTTDDEQTLTGASFAPLNAEQGGAPTTVEVEDDVTVPAGGLLTLGPEGALAGLEIDGTGQGFYVTATLTFDGAGDVAVETPVVARTPGYAEIPAESGTDEQEAEETNEEEAATETEAAS